MTINQLVKLLSCFAISGGALRVLCSFSPLFSTPFVAETLYIVTDLSIILGLIGIYLAQMEKIGNAGLSGFLIALLGFAFIAGPESVYAGVSAYALGSLVIGIGLTLLSLAQLKSGAVSAGVPLLMLAALICGGMGMVFPSMPIIYGISGAMLGIAIALNGWHAFTSARI